MPQHLAGRKLRGGLADGFKLLEQFGGALEVLHLPGGALFGQRALHGLEALAFQRRTLHIQVEGWQHFQAAGEGDALRGIAQRLDQLLIVDSDRFGGGANAADLRDGSAKRGLEMRNHGLGPEGIAIVEEDLREHLLFGGFAEDLNAARELGVQLVAVTADQFFHDPAEAHGRFAQLQPT